ncbi:MAG: motility protein A [Myxococcota bacterium]|nr:motility protein A [Myxococcota bacterium]
MDLATIVGLLAVIGLIIFGIVKGSSILIFVDPASIAIVGFGTLFIPLVAYPVAEYKSAVLGSIRKAFKNEPKKSEELLTLMRQMSTRARREGVLALEDVARTQDDEFLKRGIQMVVDGHDPEAIEDVLYSELDKIEERHKIGIGVWEYMAMASPALGMIGTLIGLVQMLQNMSDPAAIGPAMAVALLTTFYGSVIANVFCTPFAEKLKRRSAAELAEKAIVAQGLLSILSGESPRFLIDRLNVQLPPSERFQEAG